MFGNSDQFSSNRTRRPGKRPVQGVPQGTGSHPGQQARFSPQPILFEYRSPPMQPNMNGPPASGPGEQVNDGGFAPSPADGYRSFFPQWQPAPADQTHATGSALENRLAEVEAENEKLRREVEAHKMKIQSLEQKLYLLFAKIAKLEEEEK